ncbi:MAG: hypothetical protein HOG99_20535 [Gemmatimonadetes bacterium]|nr:hypothetical protein [Gemmatimonadota bacterium]MBT5589674.1 hypothetical protein [Gemmatimonadota bacterium]MBT5963941.1 hypothetical protein [Gemmatimonadota bacterium]MBT7457347.1 hypothetical protein [Gemmatimonadota bacterium]
MSTGLLPSRWWAWLVVLQLLTGDCLMADESSARWLIKTIEIRGTTRTHDDIVRRELLFAIGDTIDADCVTETERNLRRLLFLGDVRLRIEAISGRDPHAAGPDREVPAHAIVEAVERHARALSPLLDGDAEELSYGLVALDYNFLGRGQIAQVTYFHDAISGDRISASYREPRLAATRHALRVSAGYAGSESRDLSLSLSKPFHALDTRWAYGVSVTQDRQRQRLYQSGDLLARYDDEFTGSALWIVQSHSSGRWKVRPGIRLGISDRNFATHAPYEYEPAPRHRVIPSLSLTLWQPVYVRRQFIRGLGHIEDLQTGGWLTVQAGLSTRALGSDRNYPIVALLLAPRGQITTNGFFFGSLSISTRFRDRETWHLITSASGSSYVRLAKRHVLAARISYHALHRTEDRGSQLLLGIDSGLRGYAPRRFDGSRRILAGIEARPVFWQHPKLVVGAAFFADTGSAWTPGFNRQTWVSTIGAGLRLGLPTVYDAPVLRADIAHGLQASQPWQLSMGLGHLF